MPLAFLGWFLGGLTAASGGLQPGLKIVTEQTFSSGSIKTIQYVLEDRSRVEFHHPPDRLSASITRCDQQKSFSLDYADRSIMSSPLSVRSLTMRSVPGAIAQPPAAARETPTLLIETKTVQTGERKTAFGFTARRVIATERRIPLDDKTNAASETETDGWYIDLETKPACERLGADAHAVLVGSVSEAGGPPRRLPVVTFRDIGRRERGFAIETRITTRGPDYSFVMRRVVRELTREQLDPALFEIPPGFHDAESFLARLSARLIRTCQEITAFFRRG
jgi:hypothetical protein